jgi:transposase-like protein
MPVDKKEHTTSTPNPTTASSSSSQKIVPQAFHQYLREQIRDAVKIVMEETMREELTLFLGAQWGEARPERKGYRNGSYTRDLATSSGRIEDLQVPRDREGQFHTQLFERYSRYEQQVADGLTEMFVSGTSTQKVGEVAETLMGVSPSKSSVSRLNRSLSEQFEDWRSRKLQGHWRLLYLDGIYLEVRHGDKVDPTVILTALGVDLEGNKDILAIRACAEESQDGWMCLLQDLRTRGVTEVDLILTDGHDGLLAAVSALFPATPRQRCLVHKQRNVMNAIPKRERDPIAAELNGIWNQPTKEQALTELAAFKGKYRERYPEAVRSLCEDEEHLLTFYDFPQTMHRHIRSTNTIESFFRNVRRRTNQIDTFTTETSCLSIVWAVMQGIHLSKIPVS